MPARSPETVTVALLRDWPLPPADGGKEARGAVLVVGGSAENPGGAILAGEAALRCGAGKLQVATAASVAPSTAAALPEALVRRLAETESGAINGLAGGAARDLAQAASCVLIGPGLLDPAESADLVRALIDGLDVPVVLDALALSAVTADPGCVRHLAGRAVLTPNPHELALTLHEDVDSVEDRPEAAAARLAELTGAVVALGGATTWVAAPDGRLWRDDSGTAGLGVSGSGDVRAGLVAGLLARGAEATQAAVWGGHLHGRAGERLAARIGPVGYLAREILPEIPALLLEIGQ
jgi:ADP-dependent NAD(P)H-hydrate dehydratase